MDKPGSNRQTAVESLHALEAARAKREQRALEAARQRREDEARAVPRPARREPRAQVKLAAAVLVPEGPAVYGWICDIATGGCYLACGMPLALGTACTVRLTLPPEAGGGRLDLPATVARADASGMGLRFDIPDPERGAALARLVAHYELTVS